MSKRIHQNIHAGFKLFLTRIFQLMRQPIFLTITILGNTSILIGTIVLYSVEHGVNPKLHTVLDAIWWAVATVSTVGYGDISPITTMGKIVGIGLMILGTALFSTYTALFAGALVTSEIDDMEKGVRSLKKAVTHLEKEFETDEQALHRAIQTVENALSELHMLKKKKP